MRKKVYEVLRALDNWDWVSVYTCKLDGTSSRVRNEISELRRIHHVQIVTVESFIGRGAAYFLVDSDESFERVKMLLKKYKKRENKKSLK